MSNTPPLPPQPKTAQLPAADKQEILLAELKVLITQGLGALDAKVAIGFRDLDTKVDRLEANMELQGGEIGLVKKEVGLLFEWKGDVDQRLKNNSQRAAATSSVDLDHESKIASEIVARQAVEAKVDALTKSNEIQLAILSRLDKVASNPHVKIVLAVIASAAMSWAASKGLK